MRKAPAIFFILTFQLFFSAIAFAQKDSANTFANVSIQKILSLQKLRKKNIILNRILR